MNRLHIITNRISIAIAQQPSLRRNIIEDFKSLFYRRNKIVLSLAKLFPNNTFFQLVINFNTNVYIDYYLRNILSLPHYQDILDDEYNIIGKTLQRLSIAVPIDGINDISGWSIVNADYASWFGSDKRISITSGTCYFAHVLCRCLQPFIIEQQTNSNLWNIIRRRMHKQFRKTIIGLLTRNHAKAFSCFHLIPDDDSLLSGIEKFIILHEIGHAYFDNIDKDKFVWPFSNEPSPNIKSIIDSNEEIKADIFAIHTLHHIYLTDINQSLLLFAPVFFFLIYSWIEDAQLILIPNKHPKNRDRYSYLMNEIQYLHPSNDYQIYVTILNNVWIKNEKRICEQVDKMRKKYNLYSDVLEYIGIRLEDILIKLSEEDV